MSRPERASPFAHALPPASGKAAAVTLQPFLNDAVEVTARRGQEPALREAARLALGLELPAIGMSRSNGRLTALGLGPGNWSIMAAAEPAGHFVRRIEGALGQRAAVVETGHGLAFVRMSGPGARAALAKSCRLDLHPLAFLPGQAARTIMAQMPVTIWLIDDAPRFALAVPLTFAHSFAHALMAAAREGGYTILPAQTADFPGLIQDDAP